ncbi:MAG TPA: hypothetical protein VMA30_01185 [Xanthobacteraceae bacterium]|nr:hypothetical protein [Xanthobacteraceae bacterium]
MFPNLRLMIVAISASLLAIVCAVVLFMGLFAAFSVAHEPFSGLAAAKPPLQIAFADEISAPVADGKPAPFGVRFQLNMPRSGPVIVPVPAALDRVSPPEVRPAVEPISNPAANAQKNAPTNSSSVAALAQDDTQAAPPLQDAPAAGSVQAAILAEDKATEAKSDGLASNDTAAVLKAPEAKSDGLDSDDTAAALKVPVEPPMPERPAAPSVPHHIAPQIRTVSREADNPASVTTSPAPTLARKGLKRRKLAAHLRLSHHFRRPRILHQIATSQGYPQTTGFVQPNVFGPSAAPTYPIGTYGQPGGFIPGFGFTPAAIKPKPLKWRRATGGATGSVSGNATANKQD